MSAVNSLGATTSASKASSNVVNDYGSMTSGDFMKIIFTELSRQDPTQPSDSKALLEQLALIRDIESSTNLSEKLTDLVGQSEFSSAATLIGKAVSGITEKNERKIGLATALAKTDEGTVVILDDGSRMKFNNIDEIVDLETEAAS